MTAMAGRRRARRRAARDLEDPGAAFARDLEAVMVTFLTASRPVCSGGGTSMRSSSFTGAARVQSGADGRRGGETRATGRVGPGGAGAGRDGPLGSSPGALGESLHRLPPPLRGPVVSGCVGGVAGAAAPHRRIHGSSPGTLGESLHRLPPPLRGPVVSGCVGGVGRGRDRRVGCRGRSGRGRFRRPHPRRSSRMVGRRLASRDAPRLASTSLNPRDRTPTREHVT